MVVAKAGLTGTFLNIAITFMGSGILALPSGVKHAGFFAGLVLIVLFGMIFCYTAILIVRCKYLAQKSRALTYSGEDMNYDYLYSSSDTSDESDEPYVEESALLPRGAPLIKSFVDIAETAFGAFGRGITQFSIVTGQLGLCCVYIIYVTQTVQELSTPGHNSTLDATPVGPLGASIFTDIEDKASLSRWVCMFTFIWILVLLSWLPSLKFLAPTSMFATIAMSTSIGLILSVGWLSPTVWTAMVSPLELPAVKWDTLPVFFGVVGLAFSIHGIVVDFETEMEKPEKFNTVLTAATACVVLAYSAIGCVGYLYFGESTKASITDNLDDVPEISQAVVDTVKIALSISLCCTYPLQLLPIIRLTEEKVFSRSSPTVFKYILRTLMVFGTGVLAQIVPFFGLFAGLVGGFSVTLVAVILPCCCYLKLGWRLLSKIEVLLNAFVLLFGIAVAAMSTFETVKVLSECFQDKMLPQCL